jgi:hypothetical protein
MEYAMTLIKQREVPVAADTLSDESWTIVDGDESYEGLPDFKPSRLPDKNAEGRLNRLSKTFNLPTATTALNPLGWNRALKQRNEQLRHEAEGAPSEVDLADVMTINPDQ